MQQNDCLSEYISDPFSDDPYKEQSLAEMLASRDFSSCEMEKVHAEGLLSHRHTNKPEKKK